MRLFLLVCVSQAGGCYASHERAEESEVPPPPMEPPPEPGLERGWLLWEVGDRDGLAFPSTFFPERRADELIGAIGRCNTTGPADPRAAIDALGGEPVDWPSSSWGPSSQLLGAGNVDVGIQIARGDFAFAPAPSGGVRRVEMGQYDRCGPRIRLDGCAVDFYVPCASETRPSGAEAERSIAYVSATMPADESRVTIEGLDTTAETIYRAELRLGPARVEDDDRRLWFGSAVEGVEVTITEPDGSTVRFDHFGALWTWLDTYDRSVVYFWIDARTGPQPNARRFRWMADADVTLE